MSNNTVNVKVNPTLYPHLLSQNVKVYEFDTTTNTYTFLGVSQVDGEGNCTFNTLGTGTYFLTTMDAPVWDKSNAKLVYSDTFDYTGLPDSSKWAYDVGNGVDGWGNHEAEYYQDANPNNVNVNNGVLTLTALYNATGINDGSKVLNYTSTRMYTKQSWLYGKVEVTAMLPNAVGTWPAIWMMPETSTFGAWPLSGEIDIMEMENNIQDIVHGSLQSKDNYFKTVPYTNTATFPLPTTNTQYHVYGVIWTPESITFQVDGISYFSYARNLAAEYDSNKFPWTIPYYLILNIAIGGSAGGTVTSSDFPQSMKVKSVNIYDLGFDNCTLNNNYNTAYVYTPTYLNALETNFSESIIGTTSYIDIPTAQASASLNNGYQVDISNGGTANWNIQVYSTTNPLAENVTYYYTVVLNCTIARQIVIGLQNPSASSPVFTTVYNLQEGANTIKGKFTLTETMESAHFILYLGNNSTTTQLGNHTVNIESIYINDNLIQPLTTATIPFSINDFTTLGKERSVFSWNRDNFFTNTNNTAETCKLFGITQLYQSIGLAELNSSLCTTIESFNKISPNTEVCQVIGTPQWYNTSSGAMTQLEGLVAYNKIATPGTAIKTVVLDVEPWSLTDKWESDYLTVLQTLHTYTKANSLNLLITLPYWMSTTQGASNTYSSLMGAVDGVIMMNYNRNCYATAVTDQVTTAQSNNQPIYIASELQPANNTTGLTDNMTYNGVGLQTLYLNWQQLEQQYNYNNLSFCFDDLDSLQSLYTAN